MTDNENKYLAFLSYSHQDNCEQRSAPQAVSCRCWGNWLHDALETFSIPADFVGQINGRGEIIPERIQPLFQDELERPADASLNADTRKALEQSICLIVICSPRSAQSLQVNEAVRYFKQLGRAKHILPIVVAGEPNASDGDKPGLSPDDECFVPALRHPVSPDGTLDTARRAAKYIFVDARHGAEKREILAVDHRSAEADLEMAKIQLIALLLGVGFNGLWWREQKRHFFDFAAAQQQAREAINQVAEVQRQLQEAQRQTREAQNQALEMQNLPRDVHSQIQEAQNQALEAQHQAREAQKQLQEFQIKVRDTQTQLEAARQRALAAESKMLEAQHQAREAQNQLEETRNQARDAQNKIQEIQNQTGAAQSQIEAAHKTAQAQVSEVQSQVQNTQSQLDEARNQAQETQAKFLAAQRQIQEFQNQARSAQNQLEEARNQVVEAQVKVSAAQNQARDAQAKIQEIQNSTRDLQSQLKEAQNQASEARNQARLAQTQAEQIQNKNQTARRLAKVLALLAVLAALAASLAWWQRQLATQALAKTAVTEVKEPALTAGNLNREQIQQLLQKVSAAGPDEDRLRSLDELAVRIPTEEISETLNAASVILPDPQRRHFQEQLLDSWIKTNLLAAFDWSCQLTNADSRQRALEKIMPALAADNLTNTLARVNGLNPAPGEPTYTLLFQRWTALAPVQAIEQRQQIPGHDADARILSAIMTVWAERQPAAALNWLVSQPDSEALPAGTWRNQMIAGVCNNWASKDLDAATTACEQLPDSTAKETAREYILSQRILKDPASAAESVKNLPLGDYRQKAIVELCNHWVGTNAPAVLDWAQSLPSEAERIAATNRIIVNWAQHDVQAATLFASQHPELSATTFGEITSAWCGHDFTATTNWIASLPVGGKKDAALLALSETWSQNDPKGMVTYAVGLPAGEVQTRYLSAASLQLARRDLPVTVELLQPLSDTVLRQSILEQAARNCDLPHMNPAAKYIATMPAGDDQKAAIKGLLSSWAPTDPEAAVNWLGSFPETNSQPEQVPSVINAWAQREPAAVAKWLANLPAGTANEAMVSAFLEGAVVKYPEFAAQWTQSVTDETRRQKYQVQVARQWLRADPSAASKWIDSLNLPEEIKEPLKAPLP